MGDFLLPNLGHVLESLARVQPGLARLASLAWTAGLPDCRTAEPPDCRTAGLPDKTLGNFVQTRVLFFGARHPTRECRKLLLA